MLFLPFQEVAKSIYSSLDLCVCERENEYLVFLCLKSTFLLNQCLFFEAIKWLLIMTPDPHVDYVSIEKSPQGYIAKC